MQGESICWAVYVFHNKRGSTRGAPYEAETSLGAPSDHGPSDEIAILGICHGRFEFDPVLR